MVGSRLFFKAFFFLLGSQTAFSAPISFSMLKSLKLNQTTLDQASSLMGKPDGLDAVRPSKLLVWYYFDSPEGSPRLVLRFDQQTHLLNSFSWSTREPDLERAIETAKSRFKNSHFEKMSQIRNVEDLVDKYSYFYDPISGVSLSLSSDEKVVEGIHWEPPGAVRSPWYVEISWPSSVPIPHGFFEKNLRQVANHQ